MGTFQNRSISVKVEMMEIYWACIICRIRNGRVEVGIFPPKIRFRRGLILTRGPVANSPEGCL